MIWVRECFLTLVLELYFSVDMKDCFEIMAVLSCCKFQPVPSQFVNNYYTLTARGMPLIMIENVLQNYTSQTYSQHAKKVVFDSLGLVPEWTSGFFA